MSERVEFVGCGVISRTESILWRQSRNHCVGHSLGHEHDADGTSGNDIFVYEIPRVGSQPLETREQRLRGHPRGRFSSVAAPAAAAAAAAGQYMLHKLTQKSSHPTIGDGCSRLSPFVRVEGTSIAACVASRTAADRCISIVHCASSSCCSCSRRIVHDYVRRRGRRAATVSQFGLLSRRRHISLISSTHLALLVASVRWISGFCCRISLSLSLSLFLSPADDVTNGGFRFAPQFQFLWQTTATKKSIYLCVLNVGIFESGQEREISETTTTKGMVWCMYMSVEEFSLYDVNCRWC